MNDEKALQTDTRALTAQPSAGETGLHDYGSSLNTLKVPNSALIILPLGFLLGWVIAIAWLRHGRKRANSRHSPQPRQQMPCHSCLFFTNNPYLKCTVNPIDAVTQRAIDCTEYTPVLPLPPAKPTGRR